MRARAADEDDFQNPERPFAVGATVAKAAWLTTDSEWRVQPHKGGPVYKICDVKTLSLYWDSDPSDAEWCGSCSEAEIKERLAVILQGERPPPKAAEATDGGGDGEPAHNYLLAPISTTLYMVFTKPEDMAPGDQTPVWAIECVLDDVDIQLYEDQYRGLVAALVYVDVYIRWCRYRKWLPQPSIKEQPRLWWHYAKKCVRFDLDRTRAKTVITWSNFSSQLKEWSRYISLYMRRGPAGAPFLEALSEEEEKELFALEDEFSVDELLT